MLLSIHFMSSFQFNRIAITNDVASWWEVVCLAIEGRNKMESIRQGINIKIYTHTRRNWIDFSWLPRGERTREEKRIFKCQCDTRLTTEVDCHCSLLCRGKTLRLINHHKMLIFSSNRNDNHENGTVDSLSISILFTAGYLTSQWITLIDSIRSLMSHRITSSLLPVCVIQSSRISLILKNTKLTHTHTHSQVTVGWQCRWIICHFVFRDKKQFIFVLSKISYGKFFNVVFGFFFSTRHTILTIF